MLYVYALAAPSLDGALDGLTGLAGEPLRWVRAGAVHAVAGEVAAPPALSAEALRGHDRAVRAVAGRLDAVLPVRFGAVVDGETALGGVLEPRADVLAGALETVRGAEQMTLRVFAPSAPADAAEEVAAAEPDVPGGVGPGARYLEDRRRALARAAQVPEIEPLRRALGDLVRAERAERHRAPLLLASVYHLIPRGRAGDYRSRLDARPFRDLLDVRASGPWPSYAFAPEVLP